MDVLVFLFYLSCADTACNHLVTLVFAVESIHLNVVRRRLAPLPAYSFPFFVSRANDVLDAFVRGNSLITPHVFFK